MPTMRMCHAMLENSSGAISYGRGRLPWSAMVSNEREDSYGDWSFKAEPAVGWSPYSWLVTINGHVYLVDGEDKPKDPGL